MAGRDRRVPNLEKKVMLFFSYNCIILWPLCRDDAIEKGLDLLRGNWCP